MEESSVREQEPRFSLQGENTGKETDIERQTETVRSVHLFNRAEGRSLTCNFFNKRRELRFPATSKGERPDWRHRRQRRKERREQDQSLL
jgi:hypothetical protein